MLMTEDRRGWTGLIWFNRYVLEDCSSKRCNGPALSIQTGRGTVSFREEILDEVS